MAAQIKSAYVAFTERVIATHGKIADGEFIDYAVQQVAIGQFNQDEAIIDLLMMAIYVPKARIIPSDIMMDHGLLPYTNTSVAFDAIKPYISQSNTGLMHNPNGNLGFAISIEAFCILSERYPAMQMPLDHIQSILESLDIYNQAF